MSTPTKLLTEAQKWIGYIEKDSNTNLSHFTKNPGDNNYTYFADWMSKNVDKGIYANGNAWCDTFVDFCFCRAFGIARAKQLLLGFSAYTPTSAQYLKNKKQWHTTPLIGDIIFFQNIKRINHTGIVYRVDAAKVYTIEGNTSAGANTVIENGGCVAKKEYLLTNKRIAGYGRPAYDGSADLPATPATPATPSPPAKAPPTPIVSFGIDVSSYQGTINWNLVKSAGVQFAILRGVLKKGTLDTAFERNYNGCTLAGIPCAGVYQFSYALNEQTAVSDAHTMISKINGKKVDIWLDLEWADQGALGKEQVTSIAVSYVNTCKALGYNCNIYSNLDWYKHKFYPDRLRALGCKFWIARYPASDQGTVKESLKPSINEAIWQYSSKGTVPGITGHVDLNLMYGE